MIYTNMKQINTDKMKKINGNFLGRALKAARIIFLSELSGGFLRPLAGLRRGRNHPTSERKNIATFHCLASFWYLLSAQKYN